MRSAFGNLLVFMAVALYAMAPCTAVIAGTSCECRNPGGVKCGHGGFVCHCCIIDNIPCDETSFSTCKKMFKSETHSQPPAISEPLATASIGEVLAYNTLLWEGRMAEGYKPLPERPPPPTCRVSAEYL